MWSNVDETWRLSVFGGHVSCARVLFFFFPAKVLNALAAGALESPKRRKIHRVSFGSSHVRYLPKQGDDNSDSEEEQAVAEAVCLEVESFVMTKGSDGPASEAIHVNKMIVELFRSRDPTVVTETMRKLVEDDSFPVMVAVLERIAQLVIRIRATGKASLLPSCVVLRQEALPVLEWVLDCAERAVDYMAIEAEQRANYAHQQWSQQASLCKQASSEADSLSYQHGVASS